MTARQRQLRLNILAFLLLFSVSLYRQLSLRYLPDDIFRTCILYACYVLLIGAWIVSINARITQKSMRLFLTLEAVVMLIGLSIRFLQDTFWYDNIPLMRVSGMYIESTLLVGLTFGIFASLGIGQWDNYRPPRKWLLLLIPVIAMTFLSVTDESRHFMFYIIPDEPQPNLNFHPNVGLFLMVGLAIALMIVRIFLIYRRNRIILHSRFLRWFIPFLEPFLIVVFSFTFFLVSLGLLPEEAQIEVIELFARIYYIEVLTWEIYIYIGLVPISTKYPEIFRHATVGMQIIGNDGSTLLSESATEVSPEQFDALTRREHIIVQPGKALHMHSFPGGALLWNKDISLLQKTIDELNQSAETLAQEGALLDEELKTKSEEASLLAKNQIYDELTKDVKDQLWLMKEITKKRDTGKSSVQLLRSLCLLGTYIKRRCNLLLIQKETGAICDDDLLLSFQGMVSAMNMIGIRSELDWHSDKRFSPGFSVCFFDALELLLEYERFSVGEMLISAERGRARFAVTGSTMNSPEAFVQLICAKGYPASCRDIPGGYEIILTEGK